MRVELEREDLGLGVVEVVCENGVRDVGRGDRPVLVAQVDEASKASATALLVLIAVMLMSVNELLTFFEEDGRTVAASSCASSVIRS